MFLGCPEPCFESGITDSQILSRFLECEFWMIQTIPDCALLKLLIIFRTFCHDYVSSFVSSLIIHDLGIHGIFTLYYFYTITIVYRERHESDFIIAEAAARYFKARGITKLPNRKTYKPGWNRS